MVKYEFDSKISFKEIIVPTIEQIKIKNILDLLIKNGHHVILMGQQGVGKSITAQYYFHNIDNSKTAYNQINFSAQTNIDHIREYLMDKEKFTKYRQDLIG